MPSIAEEAGVSFEMRCEEALGALRRIREEYLSIATEDLRFRQEQVERSTEFLARLSESTREKVAPMFAGLRDTRADVDEGLYRILWEGGLDIARKVYGPDATDFATRALNIERAKN